MQVTLMQGILLAVAAMIIGVDFWLEALFIFNPLIVATIAGIILGDVQLGLISGAICALAFMGLTPAGGTQPPNPVLAGFMTVVIAHTQGIEPTVAFGLSLPFSIVMQYIILLFYSGFSFFMPAADKAAEEADTAALGRLNILMTGIVAASYAVIVFLSAYAAQDAISGIVDIMPEWFEHGLDVAGGMLPAVGFGLLLTVMLKAKYIPFLIVGFLVANFIPMDNLLPVALLGAAFGLYDFFSAKARDEAIEAAGKGKVGGSGRGI